MAASVNAQAENSSFLTPHTYAGRLIAAEGLDGSGKSTQLQLLSFWLRTEGYDVIVAEWTPSKILKHALKVGKKRGQMDPVLLSMLYAADMAELYQQDIVPALQRGAIVLADRYIYTAVARDLARGVKRDWIEGVYQFAARPDLGIYFQIDVDEAVARTLLSQDAKTKRLRAGTEREMHLDTLENFRVFQQRVLQAYESMVAPYVLLRLNAALPIRQQQRLIREAVEAILPSE